ncbi:MAG: acyltransferase family protein [Pseudomonadota bacterium]
MEFRREIEGLRALAIVPVVLHHVWPSAVPGGYVGVDVFFVISGFLITRLLATELSATGTISISHFYARRARRLLPAATCVIAAVLIARPLFSTLYWSALPAEALASLFYVQNWHLGFQAVDYFAIESSAGPLQHYWSLSIEEQYYLVWPLLCLVTAHFATRAGSKTLGPIVALIATLGLASLAWSVISTPKDPAMAYFSTLTRAWELALGGLLGVSHRWETLAPALRRILGLGGLGMIVGAVMLFDRASPVPGFHALLPTVGAALIIIAGRGERLSAYGLLSLAPLQYLGRLSYSLYLWHWPIIFVIAGGSVGLAVAPGIAAIFLSIAVAHFSYEMIEERFRRPTRGPFSRRSTAALASVCLAVPIAVVALQTREDSTGADSGSANFDLDAALLTVSRDRGDAFLEGCYSRGDNVDAKLCRHGDPTSETRVLLIGDSHAIHWYPAFQALADRLRWDFALLAKPTCPWGRVTTRDGKGEPRELCGRWYQNALTLINEMDPALLVFSQSRLKTVYGAPDRASTERSLTDALAADWREQMAAGRRVVALRDTPRLYEPGPECLARNRTQPERCGEVRERSIDNPTRLDPLVLAAAKTPGVVLADLTDAICDDTYCPAIRDDRIVWADSHHLTGSFAEQLAPALEQAVPWRALMKGAPEPVVSASALALLESLGSSQAIVRPCTDKSAKATVGCWAGDDSATRTLVLAGDNRAAQWRDVMDRFGQAHGFRVRHFAIQKCALGVTNPLQGQDSHTRSACVARWQQVAESIASIAPELLVLGQSRGHRIEDFTDSVRNSRRLLNGIEHFLELTAADAGDTVLIADTPRMRETVPKCVAEEPQTAVERCSTTRDRALSNPRRPDPILELGAKKPALTVVNLSDRICDPESCGPVDEDTGVVKFATRYLLSEAYASTLYPEIERALLSVGLASAGIEQEREKPAPPP